MKKIHLREDENIYILSDKQVKALKQGLVILIKNLDDAFAASGGQAKDNALADAMEKIADKL